MLLYCFVLVGSSLAVFVLICLLGLELGMLLRRRCLGYFV